jgi:beta-glucosidase
MLNVPNPGAPTIQRWKEVITTINNEANRTRLKFLFYTVSMRSMASYTAGATLFPQQIGMAATFNTDSKRGSEISAYETRASSIPWVFSPDLPIQLGLESLSVKMLICPHKWELQWLQVLKGMM